VAATKSATVAPGGLD